MHVESISTEDGFLALRASWEALIRAGAGTTPFQSWTTTHHALRINDGVVRPLVLAALDADGSVAGLLPLGVRTRPHGPFTWRGLASIGPKRLDFVDAVVTPDRAREVIDGCVDWLARHWSEWDELRLAPVRDDALLLATLRDTILPGILELIVDPVGENMALAIPDGAAAWEDVVDGDSRRTTRRILKRLGAAGFATRRVSTGYPVEAAVDAFVELHARRRGEFGETSRYLAVARSELRAMVTDAVAEGGDLMLIERTGVPAAVQLTLRLRDCVSHYRLAFDSEQRNLSPGIGLLAAGLDDAVKAGVREYDFGFGAEEYKRRWANVHRTVYRVRLKNRHLGRAPRRLVSLLSDRFRKRDTVV